MPISSPTAQRRFHYLYHQIALCGSVVLLAAGAFTFAAWMHHSLVLPGIVLGAAVFVMLHHFRIKPILARNGAAGAAPRNTLPARGLPQQSPLDNLAIAEAIPQLVWTAKPDGSVDFYNQRWFHYTGMPLSELEGSHWLSTLHPDENAACAERWNQSVSTGGAFEAEARVKQGSGVCRWHLIRALPLRDGEGRVTKWFGTCTDIDDQKRAEEAMRFLAEAGTILSASLDEIETLQNVAHLAVPKIADLCTVHLVIHGAASDQLLLAAVAHMDEKKADIIVQFDGGFPPTMERPRGLVNVILTGTPSLVEEVDDIYLDGLAIDENHREMLRELSPQSVMCVPLKGHRDILGAITFISADSGRRYTRRDLALAVEVGRRTALALDNNRLLAKVTENKVEAQAANAAKDELLAVLSHELRTPLTPVLLAVEDLVRDSSLSPNVREAIEMTHRNIILEARLIDDLLDLTRIQRGKLQLQRAPADAHSLLRNALQICNADIRNRNLRVSLGLSATHRFVHGDPARLQQVFWNLIKNAVKFTNSGGSIVFRSRNTSKGRLQIEIEDSGIGIDSNLLPNIFNAFEQGEKSRSRRFGGLGLGLAISKNLIEAHGGSIAAHSAGRDLGTTFTIELDTIDPQIVPDCGKEPAVCDAAPVPGIRILLVEDNPDTGTLLRKILERRGYHVDLATTMQSALALSVQATFDLLVSDVGLPDGSGPELMQRLRKTRHIPGIAMSGYGMDADIRRSHEAGFVDHLTKPISIAKLEESIARITASAV